MSKKFIIYIVAAFFLSAVGWQVLVASKSFAQTSTSTPTSTSPGTPPFEVTTFPNAPQGPTFQMGTSQGLVTVNNFYNIPVIIDEEFLIFQNTNQYQINYNTETSQFYLYFSSEPSPTLQSQVESDLTTLLGVSQSDACKLNVAEGYPGNLPYASQQQDLSFCQTTIQ